MPGGSGRQHSRASAAQAATRARPMTRVARRCRCRGLRSGIPGCYSTGGGIFGGRPEKPGSDARLRFRAARSRRQISGSRVRSNRRDERVSDSRRAKRRAPRANAVATHRPFETRLRQITFFSLAALARSWTLRFPGCVARSRAEARPARWGAILSQAWHGGSRCVAGRPDRQAFGNNPGARAVSSVVLAAGEIACTKLCSESC